MNEFVSALSVGNLGVDQEMRTYLMGPSQSLGKSDAEVEILEGFIGRPSACALPSLRRGGGLVLRSLREIDLPEFEHPPSPRTSDNEENRRLSRSAQIFALRLAIAFSTSS